MKKFSLITLSLLTTLTMVCGAGEVAQTAQSSSLMSTLGSYAAKAAGYALKNGSKACVWAAKGIADITGKPALFAGAAGAAAYGWYYKKQMNQAQDALNAAQAMIDKVERPASSAKADMSTQMMRWRRVANSSKYSLDTAHWDRADYIRAEKGRVAHYLEQDAAQFEFCGCEKITYSQKIVAACNYEQSLLAPLLEQLKSYATIHNEFDSFRKDWGIETKSLQDLDSAEMTELNKRLAGKLSIFSGSVVSAPVNVIKAAIYPYVNKANQLYWKLYNIHERLEAIKQIAKASTLTPDQAQELGIKNCKKANCATRPIKK